MPALSDSLAPYLATSQPTALRRPMATVNWQLLYDTLEALPRELSDPDARRVAAMELIAQLLPAEYVAWMLAGPDGECRCDQERVQAPADQFRRAALAATQKAFCEGRSTFIAWEEQWTVATSCDRAGNAAWSLVAIVPASLNAPMVCAVLQLVALSLTSGPPDQGAEPKPADAPTAAAALELAVRLADSKDLKSAAKLVCDLIRQELGVGHVALGLVRRGRMKIALAALSDVERVDRHTEAASLVTDCLSESLPQSTWVSWSKASVSKPTGLRSWQALAELWQADELVAVRLTDRSGEAVAVCLTAGQQPADERGERFLTLVGQIAGPLLRTIERGTHGRWLQAWRDRLPVWLSGWRACAIAALLLSPLVFPWSARTSCQVVLEPVAHRLVAAPFEGVFDHSLVLPGDRVQAGQILGYMDGRELRTRLAACEADATRAHKSHDLNLASGKLAAAQIDRLEVERHEHERSVFSRRLEQLEIRSPIAGVVVTGDLRRYESATLKVGQTLYEIAPLDRLVAELAVPEEDLELVTEGAPVTLWLEAAAGPPWQGSVERIHPRGELRDNRQVFIAETTLTNEAGSFRPGMNGTATIFGPRAPGASLLLRKPWHAVRTFLGI